MDTFSPTVGGNFILTPSHPSGGNNRQLFISLLVSVEKLLREIKAGSSAEAQWTGPALTGLQGLPGLCDKADSQALPPFLSFFRHCQAQNIWMLPSWKLRKSFSLHYSAPSLYFQVLNYYSGNFPFQIFSLFYKCMCFILRNWAWHIARSLVLNPSHISWWNMMFMQTGMHAKCFQMSL